MAEWVETGNDSWAGMRALVLLVEDSPRYRPLIILHKGEWKLLRPSDVARSLDDVDEYTESVWPTREAAMMAGKLIYD